MVEKIHKPKKFGARQLFFDILTAFSGSTIGVPVVDIETNLARTFGTQPSTIQNWVHQAGSQVQKEKGIIYVIADAKLHVPRVSPLSHKLQSKDRFGSGLTGRKVNRGGTRGAGYFQRDSGKHSGTR
jgi:hypothetical protein